MRITPATLHEDDSRPGQTPLLLIHRPRRIIPMQLLLLVDTVADGPEPSVLEPYWPQMMRRTHRTLDVSFGNRLRAVRDRFSTKIYEHLADLQE